MDKDMNVSIIFYTLKTIIMLKNSWNKVLGSWNRMVFVINIYT